MIKKNGTFKVFHFRIKFREKNLIIPRPPHHSLRSRPGFISFWGVDTLGIEKLIWDLIELGKTVRLRFQLGKN